MVTTLLGITVLAILYLVYRGNDLKQEDDYQTIYYTRFSQEAEAIKAAIELQLKEPIQIGKERYSNNDFRIFLRVPKAKEGVALFWIAHIKLRSNLTSEDIRLSEFINPRIPICDNDIDASKETVEICKTRREKVFIYHLKRLLKQLDSIKNVHITFTIPKPTLFTEKVEPTKAFVKIDCKEAICTRKWYLQTIAQMMSFLVPRLKIEDVKITVVNSI